MEIKIVTNLAECKKLWSQFSPHQNLWDEWGVRIAFYDPSIHQLHFLVLVEKRKKVGLLPLWYDQHEKEYTFFGGYYPEDHHFWFPLQYLPDVLERMPLPIELLYLNHEQVAEIQQKYPHVVFSTPESHYFIDLKLFQQEQQYLATFTKKHRKNFLYDLKRVQQLGLQIMWEKLEHYQDLVKFNQQRFGSESDFIHEDFTSGLQKMLQVAVAHVYTVTLSSHGKIIGLETAIFFKGVYYVLNGGYDRSYANVGKYLIWLHIEHAFKLGAATIDFLSGDTGWKELWNCQKVPYYMFRKEKT